MIISEIIDYNECNSFSFRKKTNDPIMKGLRQEELSLRRKLPKNILKKYLKALK